MRWETPLLAEELYRAAGAVMKSNGMLPVPHNYELCFRYLQGTAPALVKAFDDCVQHNRAADPDFTLALLQQHVGPGVEISQITSTLELHMQQLVDALATTSDSSAAFDSSVSVATLRLSQAEVPPELAHLINSITTATQRMVDTNRKLDMQVRSSVQELSELRNKVELLRTESLVDALTGLANRRSFDNSLEGAGSEARGGQGPLSILMCDIDHFKKFNDTWGHQTGDQVLRLVARCVSGCVKTTDVAARYGGEELSVILPRTSPADALNVAERIRALVAQRQIVKKSTGESLDSVTLSIGCAQLRPGEEAVDMLARADACLYEAKRSGRNRVCSEKSSPSENEPVTRKNLA
ncbi:MAG: GGDEF domain-containing protein [Alphaproteobacteria bacterium]|nr:GGDEF domain-containing protein [Alphaproteobacteria bacterium]